MSAKKAHLLPADDRVKLRALLGDEDNALNLAMLPWDSLRLRGASEHARSLFTCLARVSIMWEKIFAYKLWIFLLHNCKTISVKSMCEIAFENHTCSLINFNCRIEPWLRLAIMAIWSLQIYHFFSTFAWLALNTLQKLFQLTKWLLLFKANSAKKSSLKYKCLWSISN